MISGVRRKQICFKTKLVSVVCAHTDTHMLTKAMCCARLCPVTRREGDASRQVLIPPRLPAVVSPLCFAHAIWHLLAAGGDLTVCVYDQVFSQCLLSSCLAVLRRRCRCAPGWIANLCGLSMSRSCSPPSATHFLMLLHPCPIHGPFTAFLTFLFQFFMGLHFWSVNCYSYQGA